MSAPDAASATTWPDVASTATSRRVPEHRSDPRTPSSSRSSLVRRCRHEDPAGPLRRERAGCDRLRLQGRRRERRRHLRDPPQVLVHRAAVGSGVDALHGVDRGALDREPRPVPAHPALEVDRRAAPGGEVCDVAGLAQHQRRRRRSAGPDQPARDHAEVEEGEGRVGRVVQPQLPAGARRLHRRARRAGRRRRGSGGRCGARCRVGGRGWRGWRRCRRGHRGRGRGRRHGAAVHRPGQRALHRLDVHPVAVVEHPDPERRRHRLRHDLGAGVVAGQDLARAAAEPGGALGAVLAHPEPVPPPPPRKTTSPVVSAGAMAAPPESGQPAATAAPAGATPTPVAASAVASTSRPSARRLVPADDPTWGWWDGWDGGTAPR